MLLQAQSKTNNWINYKSISEEYFLLSINANGRLKFLWLLGGLSEDT